MKITFLGTAAAEGFPAVFCNCQYCQEARKKGGKNIRTRSQTLIGEDLLIDLPADTYLHFLQNGIRGDKIRYLLITHSHSDHFYPAELEMHGSCYAHQMEEEKLTVVCSEDVAKIGMDLAETFLSAVRESLDFSIAHPFEPLRLGEDYEIVPLPARHAKGETALFYMIRQGETSFLYAHDTGYFFEEVFAYIQEKGLYFNGISFDCTNCQLPIKDTGSHMGFENIGRVIERLRECGAIDDRTQLFVNHFSHNGNPIQEILEDIARSMGCEVAYDGFTAEVL